MSLGQPPSRSSRRALLCNAAGMGLALRLKEAGLITSTPDQILAKGTDFRFLQELKQELKGT